MGKGFKDLDCDLCNFVWPGAVKKIFNTEIGVRIIAAFMGIVMTVCAAIRSSTMASIPDQRRFNLGTFHAAAGFLAKIEQALTVLQDGHSCSDGRAILGR